MISVGLFKIVCHLKADFWNSPWLEVWCNLALPRRKNQAQSVWLRNRKNKAETNGFCLYSDNVRPQLVRMSRKFPLRNLVFVQVHLLWILHYLQYSCPWITQLKERMLGLAINPIEKCLLCLEIQQQLKLVFQPQLSHQLLSFLQLLTRTPD